MDFAKSQNQKLYLQGSQPTRVSDFVRLPSANDIIGSSFKTRYSEVPRPSEYDIKFIPSYSKKEVEQEAVPLETKPKIGVLSPKPMPEADEACLSQEQNIYKERRKSISLPIKAGIAIALFIIVIFQARYIYSKLGQKIEGKEEVPKSIEPPKEANFINTIIAEEEKKFYRVNDAQNKAEMEAQVRRAHLVDTIFKRIKSEIEDLRTMKLQEIDENISNKYGAGSSTKLREELIQRLNDDAQLSLKTEAGIDYYEWAG